MSVRFVDEGPFGVGWIEKSRLHRTSHALVADGRVWLVDPVDGEGVEQRIRELGEPAGVIQLLDRHERDGPALAERLGVPLHVVPGALDGTPFHFVPVVSSRRWREVALWWADARVLACADAIGTLPFFRAGSEPVGVHPFLRLWRPPRLLAELRPRHILVGHGEGLHGDGAAAALEDALRHARRRFPRWLLRVPEIVRAG